MSMHQVAVACRCCSRGGTVAAQQLVLLASVSGAPRTADQGSFHGTGQHPVPGSARGTLHCPGDSSPEGDLMPALNL